MLWEDRLVDEVEVEDPDFIRQSSHNIIHFLFSFPVTWPFKFLFLLFLMIGQVTRKKIKEVEFECYSFSFLLDARQ